MKKMVRIFTLLTFAFSLLISIDVKAQKTTNAPSAQQNVFPKGQKVSNQNMTGTVWMNVLTAGDSIFNYHIASVTFEPGARTHWHTHPGGQLLLATEGLGYYQEKGKPIQLFRKGDVIKCAPDVEHWHGASPNSEFIHIGITNNTAKGLFVWLQRVTDEEYNSIK
jgi:quercetin dioxygenase-like cupin family protein